MKIPPFLIPAALLLWGLQTQLLFLAIPLSILIEISRMISVRWDFKVSDISRITDVCTIIFAGTFIFFLSTRFQEAILSTLQFLPVIMFPLVCSQVYSVKGRTDIRSLFLVVRKKKKRFMQKEIDLVYPYIALCLISQGSANIRSHIFYLSVVFVLGLGLFYKRSKSHSVFLWAGMFLLAAVSGFGVHHGLTSLQEVLMNMRVNMYLSAFSDPYKRETAIGDIGLLKQSNRIVARVIPDAALKKHFLLRESSYDYYNKGTWHATRYRFWEVPSGEKKGSWILNENSVNEQSIIVSSPLQNGKSMIRVPYYAKRIENLDVATLKKNNLGAIRLDDGPGRVTYRVFFNDEMGDQEKPDRYDLNIPEKDRALFVQLAETLNLSKNSPGMTMAAIDHFFQENFTYSLELGAPEDKSLSALSYFMVTSRTGHCEYFATATVMLLRAAGIPARYVFGYSAHEFSELEKKIVVRIKHAHAWTEIWVNGQWIWFDTTPSSWQEEEKSHPAATFFSDVISLISYWFSRLRWDEEGLRKHVLWLLIPLLFIVIRRLSSGSKIKREKGRADQSGKGIRSAEMDEIDEALFSLEKKLFALGFKRKKSETWQTFLMSVRESFSSRIKPSCFNDILDGYYKTRFDKTALSEEKTGKLKENIHGVIKKLDDDLKSHET